MQRSFLYLSRVITSYNPGQNCWDISMQFSISHHATTSCKSTWDAAPYFGIDGLSMILCLWSPLHPLSKLLAIQDHTQNLEEQLWMGGRREVSIIFYRPVTRSDLKRERSFFRGSVSSFLQLVESSRPKGTNSPPSPPLVQCRFGLTAQVCISCVIINNIAKVEGGNGLLICDGKHFCQGEWKKQVFL